MKMICPMARKSAHVRNSFIKCLWLLCLPYVRFNDGFPF